MKRCSIECRKVGQDVIFPISESVVLRRWVTQLWGKVYIVHLSQTNTIISSLVGWLSKIIKTFWEYNLSIWEYRNGRLHGHTLEESGARELEAIKKQTTDAYEEYSKDHHFIIPRHLSSLFTSCSTSTIKPRH